MIVRYGRSITRGDGPYKAFRCVRKADVYNYTPHFRRFYLQKSAMDVCFKLTASLALLGGLENIRDEITHYESRWRDRLH